MNKINNVKNAIKVSSFIQSSDLDLDTTTRELWPAILALKNFLVSANFLPSTGYFLRKEDKNSWEYFVPKEKKPFKFFEKNFKFVIEVRSTPNFKREKIFNLNNQKSKTFTSFYLTELINQNLNSKITKMVNLDYDLIRAITSLSLYLPIILGEWEAKQSASIFVTGHLTQSEDGKIAKKDGSPIWLGGELDKMHTHRLRSLHGSLLIGSKTLKHDNPQLNVRHCEGKNPDLIIFKTNDEDFFDKKLFQLKKRKIFLLCRNQREMSKNFKLKSIIKNIKFDGNKTFISPKEILTQLVKNNIHSIFIEGGGITISHFLVANLFDRFHLQTSDKTLGSGINSFNLPTSSDIENISAFIRTDYKIDEQTLSDYSKVIP